MLDAVEHRESFGDGMLACVGRVCMEGPVGPPPRKDRPATRAMDWPVPGKRETIFVQPVMMALALGQVRTGPALRARKMP